MKLNSTQSTFYDQDRDYSFRTSDSAARKKAAAPVSTGTADFDIPDFMKQRRSKNSRVRTNSYGDVAEFSTPKKEKTQEQLRQERLKKRKQAELKRKKAAR